MKRGEIWWTDLADPQGSQPGFRRPVVVVQDDLLTESLLGTVMIVPLTTNLQRRLAIGNVELTAKDSGLPKSSVALVCQVMTVGKELFSDRVGSVPRRKMLDVDRGLRLALGLGMVPA